LAEITQTSASASTKLAAVDIHKRYGDNEVLKGVSLNAKAGDVISIIGASGSGKSTFLRCINFLERPNAGQIVVGEEVVRGIEPMRREAGQRSGIGRLHDHMTHDAVLPSL